MYVILDTSVVIKDYYFKTPKFEALWDYLGKTPHDLLLPRIVIDELKKNHSEEVGNTSATLEKTRDGANQVLNIALELPNIDQQEEEDKYDKFLLNLEALSRIKVLPLKDEYLPRIAKRAVHRIAPFKKGEKDDGFKDAIIWETVIDSLSQKEYEGGVAFITKNVRQFSSVDNAKKDVLNEELAEEVAKLPNRMEYFTSLEAFMEKYARNLEIVSIRNLQKALDAEVDQLVGARRLSERELIRLFHSAFGYPIDSIGVIESPIKRFYVYKVDDEFIYVQARGLLKAWVTLWNPIDEVDFDDEEDTVFEATFTINRKNEEVQVVAFEPQEVEPRW